MKVVVFVLCIVIVGNAYAQLATTIGWLGNSCTNSSAPMPFYVADIIGPNGCTIPTATAFNTFKYNCATGDSQMCDRNCNNCVTQPRQPPGSTPSCNITESCSTCRVGGLVVSQTFQCLDRTPLALVVQTRSYVNNDCTGSIIRIAGYNADGTCNPFTSTISTSFYCNGATPYQRAYSSGNCTGSFVDYPMSTACSNGARVVCGTYEPPAAPPPPASPPTAAPKAPAPIPSASPPTAAPKAPAPIPSASPPTAAPKAPASIPSASPPTAAPKALASIPSASPPTAAPKVPTSIPSASPPTAAPQASASIPSASPPTITARAPGSDALASNIPSSFASRGHMLEAVYLIVATMVLIFVAAV